MQLPCFLRASLGGPKAPTADHVIFFFSIKTKAEALDLNASDLKEDFRDGDVTRKKCLL